MQLWDKRLDFAHRKMAQIFDASERSALEPLERVIKSTYDAWGGPSAFGEDLAEYIKRLADSNKLPQAINAMLNVMKLHGKVDKMNQEEEWRAMDDENVKTALQMKLAQMMTEMLTSDEKSKMLQLLLGEQTAEEADEIQG